MICVKCGNTLAESAKFCPKCGEKVDPLMINIMNEEDTSKLVEKAYYYLEEKNINFVQCCIERLSFLDLSNKDLHIIKLLIECNVYSLEELKKFNKNKINDNVNYKRILKYSDQKTKELFEGIERQISDAVDEADKLEKERIAREEENKKKLEEEKRIEQERIEREKREKEEARKDKEDQSRNWAENASKGKEEENIEDIYESVLKKKTFVREVKIYLPVKNGDDRVVAQGGGIGWCSFKVY